MENLLSINKYLNFSKEKNFLLFIYFSISKFIQPFSSEEKNLKVHSGKKISSHATHHPSIHSVHIIIMIVDENIRCLQEKMF